MQFARKLKNTVYKPWTDKYIDYEKLKQLLRESGSDAGSSNAGDEDEWTEKDEEEFVQELVNVQLEKVADFQSTTLKRLQEETEECEKKLEPLGVGVKEQPSKDGEDESSKKVVIDTSGEKSSDVSDEDRKKVLNEVLEKLNQITKETNELEKYSRINYTGFQKAAKKHDRKRGTLYRVRPLLQNRLAALPFYKEDYAPLVYRLSAMYSFVRQSLDGKDHKGMSFVDSHTGAETYNSYKCKFCLCTEDDTAKDIAVWVHPENLLEVKTIILRRLPVLVYNPQTSKVADGTQADPTITSIYFDNPQFKLYSKKVDSEPDAPSLRLRWYGELDENRDVLFEKKIIKANDESEEDRFALKDKYVHPVITNEYHMEKSIQKLKERDSNKAEAFEAAVKDIQSFITENKLQPVVRANYSRTAYEIPGDDRIRISLDTNLAFIREDAIDVERPCRDPEEWHRRDIDDNHMEWPFNSIRKGEISRFPYAVLEIKVKGAKRVEWIDDLMHSHLVTNAAKFSKFVHGVATLFDDYVNTLPFWLSKLETDIRRDPQEAFEEEQERKAQMASDDVVVGSLFGPKGATPSSRHPFRGSISQASPTPNAAGMLGTSPKITADMTRVAAEKTGRENVIEEEDSDDDGMQGNRDQAASSTAGLRQLFPGFSMSKYARSRRGEFRDQKLPPGVVKPAYWIKDQGPLKVEPKVWLANQRTFVKWQHFSVLLASLSLGLYNAAGPDNHIGRNLGIVYTVFALFAIVWGWGVTMWRSSLIRARSGTDFDARLGPLVVAVGLMISLVANFAIKVRCSSNVLLIDLSAGLLTS